MQPNISVLIPSKNRLWSLPKAVESCRSNELNIEIIVVDDDSSDGTAEWLATQRDIVHLKGNGWGKPSAMNMAVKAAQGKYVRFLDSDDWLNSKANESQFRIAENEKSDVVVSGYDFYEDEILIKSVPWIVTDDFISQALGECDSSTYIAFLFKKEFIIDIPHRTHFPAADFASRDDRCFILEVALKKPKISFYQKTSVCVRHHKKKRLQFHQDMRRCGTNLQTIFIYRQILNILNTKNELTERRKRAAAKILWPLAHNTAYTHFHEATEIADWVYKLDPTFKIPELGILKILYKYLGFRVTEMILRIRRVFVSAFRRKVKNNSVSIDFT